MITPTQMYWLVKLDNIVTMSAVFAILSFIVAIVCFMIHVTTTVDCDDDDDSAIYKTYWTRLIAASCLMAALGTFVPTTKQMAAIIVVPKIANSEKVQTVGNRLYDLAVEWMNEFRPTTNKGSAASASIGRQEGGAE